MEVYERFWGLLQIATGKEHNIGFNLLEEDWYAIYKIASKQCVLGSLLHAADVLSGIGQKPPMVLSLQWICEGERIRRQNKRVDLQCDQLTSWFKQRGYSGCIIKGQGVARLYNHPELRQPGDIDIWVDGDRDDIIKKLRSNFIGVTYVDYVNCHAGFFTDTEVEVHFTPTWFYNPLVNRRVQDWVRETKDVQMKNLDEKLGFYYPTVEFNLVFSLIHIFRHVLFEGIGLRQLTDYYFILHNSKEEERQRALVVLKSFGIGKFVGAVMYVMKRVYCVEPFFLMCMPDVQRGEVLLAEIMRGGNFGQYDDRIKRINVQQRWKRGWGTFKRDMRFVKDYPYEVLWMPIWKVWHYLWRMRKGYLDKKG